GRFRQRDEFPSSLLQQIQELWQHYSFKAANVQQHDVLNVMSVNQLRLFWPIGQLLFGAVQITLLQLLNGLLVILRQASCIWLVVVVVAEAESDLRNAIVVLFQEIHDGMVFFQRFTFVKVGEAQPAPVLPVHIFFKRGLVVQNV